MQRSRIAEKKFRQIIYYFSLDISASDTARLTEISVRSINDIHIKIRRRLAEECEKTLLFQDKLKWMNHTLNQREFEEREAEVLEIKPLYFDCSNVMVTRIQKLFCIRVNPHYKGLYEEK